MRHEVLVPRFIGAGCLTSVLAPFKSAGRPECFESIVILLETLIVLGLDLLLIEFDVGEQFVEFSCDGPMGIGYKPIVGPLTVLYCSDVQFKGGVLHLRGPHGLVVLGHGWSRLGIERRGTGGDWSVRVGRIHGWKD